MPDDRCRLGSEDVVIGLDLASAEHQAVVLTAAGQRLPRFRIPHTRAGLEDLLRRTTPAALGRAGGARVSAFEAIGHLWEAVAYVLRARGEQYVVVNPLATFRVREARQLSREKTDLTDAEQIAELCRTGLGTRTQLETRPYLALRRAWGEYVRLREERARLKVLRVWADLLQPGALAVLRTGLTPAAMAALSLTEFVAQVRAHGAGHRIWRFKLAQVHREAAQTMACPDGLDVLAREVHRAVARMDRLTAHMTAVAAEIDVVLAELAEVPYLRTIPGLGWASVAGLLAHVGAITKYHHGQQLIKLAGTNPSRRDSGQTVGRCPSPSASGASRPPGGTGPRDGATAAERGGERRDVGRRPDCRLRGPARERARGPEYGAAGAAASGPGHPAATPDRPRTPCPADSGAVDGAAAAAALARAARPHTPRRGPRAGRARVPGHRLHRAAQGCGQGLADHGVRCRLLLRGSLAAAGPHGRGRGSLPADDPRPALSARWLAAAC